MAAAKADRAMGIAPVDRLVASHLEVDRGVEAAAAGAEASEAVDEEVGEEGEVVDVVASAMEDHAEATAAAAAATKASRKRRPTRSPYTANDPSQPPDPLGTWTTKTRTCPPSSRTEAKLRKSRRMANRLKRNLG